MNKPETKSTSIPIVLWGIACIIVAGAIAGGLCLTGGPHIERQRHVDHERSDDLGHLRDAIQQAYSVNGALPVSVAKLKEVEDYTHDPVTGKPYAYRQTRKRTFQLCATFERDTRNEISTEYEYYKAFMKHSAGFYCFNQETDDTPNTRPTIPG